jgi:hypothetical protein
MSVNRMLVNSTELWKITLFSTKLNKNYPTK